VRQILMTVMLVIVIIALYTGTFGGEAGTAESVRSAGQRINKTIESINP